jgi:hypothetical protein
MIDSNPDDSKGLRTFLDSGLNDLPDPLKDTVKTLYCCFRELKKQFGIQKSDATMFSTLLEYPCPVRCINELKKPYKKPDDNLYSAEEKKAKRILIEEIYARFGISVKLEEEKKISSGTLDLAIVLPNKGRIIGIEIKNGSSEQTYGKMLDQIERYLIHTYLLLVIRIPKETVHQIERDVDYLNERIETITKRANQLISGDLSIHECKWCTDNKQLSASKYQSDKPGPIANIDISFYTNVLKVAKKTIDILEEEFRKQGILEKDNGMIGQERHTEITDDLVDSISDRNEDDNGEAYNIKISDNWNGKGSGESGSIKWHCIKDLKSGMAGVNVKGKIHRIMPPRAIKNGTQQVTDVEISDYTGSINMALFNGQIKDVKQGDEVYIENGYTGEFQSLTTLYVGRYGKLTMTNANGRSNSFGNG